MTRQRLIVTALALCWTYSGLASADEFEHVTVFLEQNVSDEDCEVVFEATGGDSGLATLKISAPDGRTIVDFKAADSELGLRSFSFESPEPENDGSVQADFPAGEYTFMGTTVDGEKLRSRTTLNHSLPAAISFVHPQPEAESVSVKGLEVAWRGVKNVSAYILEIEQEESAFSMLINVPSTSTSFRVPDGLLAADTEYKIAIGTVTANGNKSFVETEFTTAGDSSAH